MLLPTFRRLFCLSCGLLLFLLFGTLAVPWPATSAASQTAMLGSPGFSITISTSDATIKSGTELIVTLMISNISNHAINLDLDEADYRVEVRDEHGELAKPAQNGRTLADSDSQFTAPKDKSFLTIPMQTGETTKAQINVSQLFDLSWPGKYTISVQGYDRENKAQVLSNMIGVTVVQVQCTAIPVNRSATPESGSRTRTANPPVSVTLSTKRHYVRAGDEIVIEESVANLSDSPIATSPFYAPGVHVKDVFDESLDMKDSGGCPVKRRPDRQLAGGSRGIPGALMPHQTRKDSGTVSYWNDFRRPGVYTIQKILRSQKTRQAIVSNILTIIVFEDCMSYGGPLSSDQVYSVDRPTRTPVGTIKQGQPLYECKTGRDYSKKACAPVLIHRVDSRYTEEARQAKLTGTVVLGFLVDDRGKTADVRVLESLGKGLDEEAVAAVKQWKYKPGLYKGEPFPVNARVGLEFGCLSAKYPKEFH